MMATTNHYRFGIYQYQHLPIPTLRERWQRAEALGFDVLWNVDTVVDPDRPRSPMFDGPATLAAMALATSRIRVGTLVTSLYFRHPVLAARSAVTIDHLSNGRVEVALGVGDPSAGPAAVGLEGWSAQERVDRFREFVELTELLLRSETANYDGRFYQSHGAEVIPGPVQKPRPPIRVSAHGPRMLRIAAQSADGWDSWGGYEVETDEDFYRVTAERSARLDALCHESGRDPRSVRRSVTCFPPLAPWTSVGYFESMVGRLSEFGITEFVLYWPGRWTEDSSQEDEVFERVATDVIPRLRRTS